MADHRDALAVNQDVAALMESLLIVDEDEEEDEGSDCVFVSPGVHGVDGLSGDPHLSPLPRAPPPPSHRHSVGGSMQRSESPKPTHNGSHHSPQPLHKRQAVSTERLTRSPLKLSLGSSEDRCSIGSASQVFAPVQFSVGGGGGCSASQASEDAPLEPPLSATTDPGLQAAPLFAAQRSKSTSELYDPRPNSLSKDNEGSADADSESESKLFHPLRESHNASKLSKRESLKVEKKKYRKEKKRAAKELLSTLKDPSVIVMADWLKVRGSLKSWTRLWCVLKPGLIVLYKSHKQKSSHWVGTVLLNTCELLERPSKKDGFCFKLFHPLDQSIWATKGPKGENFGAITQPLPYSYLIFRAPSEAAGKCWMDALELALRCSNLLIKTMTRDKTADISVTSASATAVSADGSTFLSPLRQQMNESDCERHFADYGLEEDARTDREEEAKAEDSASDSDHSEDEEEKEVFDEDLLPLETPYQLNLNEELGQQGDASQTEEVADENKSIIWTLVKQVRPGMDLSKVVLPTFILEPRSLLDKFTDYYYHADLLSEAVKEEDAFTRIKSVVRWYLSGFYKKPKGLKKPYNPILGETFRCYWRHPNGTRSFYLAEQISHHPPVSAFYVTNRQDGFSISGSVLAKSKFYGNSLSAIMDGGGRLTFLKRGEDYVISMPYAHCKGILIGTLTMELGGKVTIDCEKTGYRAELEFKLKPFLGTGEASNKIVGKIKLGTETLATIDGKWDQEIFMKDKRTGDSSLFWNPSPEIKEKRLHRFTVPPSAQTEFESERLWQHVTAAIVANDQEAATKEKFILEEAQRREARERKAKMEEWMPKCFERNEITGDWEYKFKDLRPWDPMNDVVQFEHQYIVQTKTRHRTPIVRTTSISNVDGNDPVRGAGGPGGGAGGGAGGGNRARMNRMKRGASLKQAGRMMIGIEGRGSGSSTPDVDEDTVIRVAGAGDSESDSDSLGGGCSGSVGKLSVSRLRKALRPLADAQKEQAEKLTAIQSQLIVLTRNIGIMNESNTMFCHRDLFLVGMVLAVQLVMLWMFR